MGPLAGVRVLDLSAVVSGPLAGTLLADQGAEVIKVERLGGDIQRNVGSKRNGYSGSFHVINRGKRSIAVDLSQPKGVQIVQHLASSVDVVLQNFRPGVADRLGIGYAGIAARNPRVIYLSISGFGQTGPNAGRRAYDPIIQMYSGLADVQGLRRGEGPEQVNQLLMDKLTAYTGFQAITAALYAREKNGAGQHIELSMLDTAVAFMWPDAGADNILLGEDIDHHAPISAAGTIVELVDGWGAIMTLSDQEFQGLCRALELEDIAADNRFNTLRARQEHRQLYVELIKQRITAATQGMTVAALTDKLEAEHVPFARARTLDELPVDEQITHNEMFFERQHPVAGRVREARPAPRFSATPTSAADFGPTVGQHTREILTEAGFAAEIEALLAAGVVGADDEATSGKG
ncbi:MAG: crotonobetainyl-CoA:carnitine CoA-transferase CaiB-like acyl-CoA transferase [Candidatus Azotimanducaceae bacterium]|jgi:crotonobetainyl-CoA:carnitine CoA-transferase CaiB-like acyl-CoA transferase